MSVPGAISPVEIDGRLLVDGGIADNLPINVARGLCGDVIIAVNISTPPLKRAEITSALSVVGQLINFLGMENVDKQLKSLGDRDVLISPDLGDISAGKFDRSRDAIRIGEDATRAMAAQLKRYSLPPEQYAALRRTQVAEAKALGTVDEIRVEGLQKTNPAVALALVESKPGEPLTEEKVGADLRRIFGTRDFESISYRIVGGDGGPRAMLIEPKEKSWGADYLRFGLGLASDFQGDNLFNALVQYRKSWLNKLGGEWQVEAQVGQSTHIATEFFQPVTESGQWFVAPNAYVGNQSRGVFNGDDKIAEYLISSGQFGLDFGASLGTWGQARVGPVWTKVYARPDTGASTLPSLRETTAGIRASFFVDQADHAWFPSDGYRLGGTAYAAMTSFGSALSYQRLEGTARAAKSWGPHTVNVAVSGGTALGSDMPAYESFALGGPLKLSGYRINELSGREYAYGRAMYYNRVLPLPDLLGSGVYVGGAGEIARITDRVDGLQSPGTVWSGAAFLGADTFAGPAYLGFGFAGGGRWNLFMLLGAP
jgi:NTE family protein